MSKTAAPATRRDHSRPSFARGQRVLVSAAGRDWPGRISERELPDGSKSVHPQHDDTAVYVTFDETGISAPVSISQVSRIGERR